MIFSAMQPVRIAGMVHVVSETANKKKEEYVHMKTKKLQKRDKDCAGVLVCPLPSRTRRMQAQLKHAAWESPLKFLAMKFSGAFIITLWDGDWWDITRSHNIFEQPVICNIIMVMQL